MRQLIFICLLLATASYSYGQLPCATDEHQQALLQRNPQLASLQNALAAVQRNAHRTTATDTGIYDIPIVVHMVHDYGTEDLPDDSIFSYVAQWNLALAGANADTSDVIPTFKPYVGKPNFKLHLATIDPLGKPTKGILHFQSYLTDTGNDEAKFNQWPHEKYLNIYLVNTLSLGTAYAYFPSSADFYPYYDGIIAYASVANYMQTIPHETGHIFSLYHTWGNIGCGTACGSSDSVDDTPPTIGHLVTYCVPSALYDTTCATGYMVHYLSSLGADSVVDYPDTANSQNIMDYTYCPKMFTKGQAARMRAGANNTGWSRSNLKTAANLAATGALAPMPDLPPVADFIVDAAVGAGSVIDKRSYFLTFNNAGSFEFRNASWNDTISSVAWTFSNGAFTPTSGSMTVVDNKFTVPGWVAVSLIANSNAGSDTLTNTHEVYAADTVAAGGSGYFQNFASAAAISNWPMFNYYNNQFKWEFFTGAGVGDNTCVRYRSFDTSSDNPTPRLTGTARGDFDDFFTPAFNIPTTLGSSMYLNFVTCGAATMEGLSTSQYLYSDTLEVYASITGGRTWKLLATYGGSDLANNGLWNSEFTPYATSAWVPRAVAVPAAERSNNTFFRFRYRPGNMGNNLYMDNFYLYPFPAGIKEAIAAGQQSFQLFPNPATNGCSLVFKTGPDGVVSYNIKDITGKVLFATTKTLTPGVVAEEQIPRSLTPAAGLYLVTLTTGGTQQTQKLTVY